MNPCPSISHRSTNGTAFLSSVASESPHSKWKNLEGKTLLADHGLQPLVMLKYALKQNGVDWEKIKVVDAGTPEQSGTFLDGAADHVHLQGPVVAGGEVIASVGV